jgi:hypothetical protein
MPRPGVDGVITDATAIGGTPLDSGQGFMLGLAERGPIDLPVELRSLRSYERACGTRIGGPVAHDSVRAFFTNGGSVLQFLRVAGATAKAAEAEVGALNVSASSPGTWGNSLTVALEADAGVLGRMLAAKGKSSRRAKAQTRDDPENGNGEPPVDPPVVGPLVRVVVRRDGSPVERSQLVATAEDAVGWSEAFSAFVSLDADDLDATLEVTAAKPLTGGTNDGNVTPEVVGDSLDHFGAGLGPGQVAYPGAIDPGVHAVILDHAERYRRCALLDLDDADEVTVASEVMGLYQYSGARFAAALAPRLRYVGPAPTTTILLPYSAAQMGVIARRDRATGNPNEPAAGEVAYIVGARGLAREFSDDVREELNELGVTLARVRGRPAATFTYGSRTCAGPNEPNWKWFGGSRVVMAITHESDAGAEQFVHRQIDPQRRIFVALNSVLTAICERYFALGALYGDTAEEAYQVDTSDAVNTPETIQNGEIHGLIRLATSPPGEWVVIEIAKQTSSLAAAA